MKNKNILGVVGFILVIATWLDLEYKGLFYQVLPEEVQKTIDGYTILNKN